MLKAGDPVDIKLWTKSGEIQEWRNCIPLRYNFYKGTQQFKLLNSGGDVEHGEVAGARHRVTR